jgi:hypothetical protein
MGIALILAQVVLDVVLVAAAVAWYRVARRERVERERVTACLNVLESHGARHEQEWNVLRGQLQEQLRDLHRICEEAKGILLQGQSAMSSTGNSREERELRDAFGPDSLGRSQPQSSVPTPAEPVPTVAEVLSGQNRPKPAGWLDLKTLLREQLV